MIKDVEDKVHRKIAEEEAKGAAANQNNNSIAANA